MSGETQAERNAAYWRQNLRYLAVLLSLWFLVSFGCGILLREPLDAIRIGGFKLGFWFAQQGSILVFVVLIFVYVALMNRLDRRFGARDETGSG
jgi:putative solute:sodium symporter small subunit